MAKSNQLGTIALNYGLMLGLVSFILQLIEYFFGDYAVGQNPNQNVILLILGYVATIVFPVLATMKLKKAEGGFLDFGQGFKMTFVVLLYSGILGILWLIVYTMILEPNYVDIAIANIEQGLMESDAAMSGSQMETTLNYTAQFFAPGWLISFVVLGTVIMAAILGLILGAIMQKKRPPHMEMATDNILGE